ncbi:hypothetical protein INT44_004815, partial [Umbelopsis vinacea]
ASWATPLPKIKAKLSANVKAGKASISLSVDLFSGLATWFTPNKGGIEGGPLGACGPRQSNDDMIVALNAAQYGDMNKKSKHCGRKVLITGPNGKKATAVINDACPGCKKNSLDLTPVVFKKLGSLDTGILKIKWKFI